MSEALHLKNSAALLGLGKVATHNLKVDIVKSWLMNNMSIANRFKVESQSRIVKVLNVKVTSLIVQSRNEQNKWMNDKLSKSQLTLLPGLDFFDSMVKSCTKEMHANKCWRSEPLTRSLEVLKSKLKTDRTQTLKTSNLFSLLRITMPMLWQKMTQTFCKPAPTVSTAGRLTQEH